MRKSPKIGLVSLGCAKNLVDAQRLTSVLIAMGDEIENEYSKCDAVIVNTCGFIGPAVEESMQAIGEALNYSRKVIVTGCLGARAKVILDKYPQVAAVYGPGMRATCEPSFPVGSDSSSGCRGIRFNPDAAEDGGGSKTQPVFGMRRLSDFRSGLDSVVQGAP